ncbi:MAG: glycosyltransferase family 4 protein [Actinomycetota bacterium]
MARREDPVVHGHGGVPLRAAERRHGSDDDVVAATRRPRLLIAITLAEIGGAQTYVAHLLPRLVEEFDVTVAAWGPGPLVEAAERAGAKYVPLRHVRRAVHPWHDLLGLVELYRLFRRERPEIVHANSSKAGILARIAAPLAGVPIRIFTVHGWAFSASTGLASTLYRVADRLVSPLTSRIVCVAESERDAGLRARTCSARRTVVIPNAVDVGAQPRASLEDEPPAILSVGRLKAPKDFVTLARVLARLDRGSFTASIAGDGPDRERVLAELRGVEGIELLGDRDDVPELLAQAQVFVLATCSEGMPVSVLEAMAAGLPVVASDVGGVGEIVVDGETGLLVPPGDEAALERALRRLIASPDLRRRLGDAGRERAEREFDLPQWRERHVELYREELAARGLPSSARHARQK